MALSNKLDISLSNYVMLLYKQLDKMAVHYVNKLVQETCEMSVHFRLTAGVTTTSGSLKKIIFFCHGVFVVVLEKDGEDLLDRPCEK